MDIDLPAESPLAQTVSSARSAAHLKDSQSKTKEEQSEIGGRHSTQPASTSAPLQQGTKRKLHVDFQASEEQRTMGLFQYYQKVTKEEWLEIEHDKMDKYNEEYRRGKHAAEEQAIKKTSKARNDSRIRSQKYRDRKKKVSHTVLMQILPLTYKFYDRHRAQFVLLMMCFMTPRSQMVW